MRKRKPNRKCADCVRLKDGRFSKFCDRCKNRYTSDKKTNAKVYEYKGMIMTAGEWAKELGYANASTIHYHLRQGKGIADIIERSERSVFIEWTKN